MLTAVVPGKPKAVDRDLLDAPLRQLVEAAETGQPLEPVMGGIVRSFGFDSFLYAMATVSRPDRDSKSYFVRGLPKSSGQ